STHQAKPPAPPTSPKRLIQQGGAGGFACRSNGHNQWSAYANADVRPTQSRFCDTVPGSLMRTRLLTGLAAALAAAAYFLAVQGKPAAASKGVAALHVPRGFLV